MKRSTKKRFVISGIILMLLPIFFALIGGIVLHFIPRQYFADVQMQVKPDSAIFEVFGNNSSSSGKSYARIDPQFVESQFQILRTKEILYPVIDKLDLASKFAKKNEPKAPEEIVYQELLKKLDLKQIRNTNLIDIGVFAEKPQLAADIANEVAAVYQKARRDEVKKFASQGVEQVKQGVAKQQKKTDAAYAALEKIAAKKGISITVSDSPEEKNSPEYMTAKQNYNEAKKLLQAAQKSFQSQSMQKTIQFDPAHIWQSAEPLAIPAKPSIPLTLAIFAGAGIPFAIIGFILLLIGIFRKSDDAAKIVY